MSLRRVASQQQLLLLLCLKDVVAMTTVRGQCRRPNIDETIKQAGCGGSCMPAARRRLTPGRRSPTGHRSRVGRSAGLPLAGPITSSTRLDLFCTSSSLSFIPSAVHSLLMYRRPTARVRLPISLVWPSFSYSVVRSYDHRQLVPDTRMQLSITQSCNIHMPVHLLRGSCKSSVDDHSSHHNSS